ncbi:hypothetical protein NUW58_g7438 [Xylaria curta]|uniref:Uncharacterized protein n=1 Tax=Xylaria curta TaxID=42375 RepID=A0ACC1NH02_9PEZI|nr:hypothetical protein NUW58_g7438 [Xylaria curta]
MPWWGRSSRHVTLAGAGRDLQHHVVPLFVRLRVVDGERLGQRLRGAEVLLSPGKDIAVYTRGGNLSQPLRISKSQFAGHVWSMTDAMDSRQLIDHYLGNLELSRLELATIALRCLYKRNTRQYLEGDHTYALMGLLRLRPEVDKTDTEFQAFARISLANDSDRLLERYLCTMPANIDQPWHDMEDAYHSSLWDIEPYCQVAAICEDDTVIIDGARGASIRWKSFLPVAFRTAPSVISRNSLDLANRSNTVASALRRGTDAQQRASIHTRHHSPWPRRLRRRRISDPRRDLPSPLHLHLAAIAEPDPDRVRGKFTQVQAALFGFEGYLNAPAIERAIFGGDFGRFGWSVNGSPLSRFEVNEFGERIGIDPTKDPLVRMKVEQAKRAEPGDMRIFTLVDTYNMEITLFEAVRPPTVIFCCASEGGMQRAIGCSYDWTTQTMYREVVLRLPTQTLNSMDRVPRVRIGTKRPADRVKRVHALSV